MASTEAPLRSYKPSSAFALSPSVSPGAISPSSKLNLLSNLCTMTITLLSPNTQHLDFRTKKKNPTTLVHNGTFGKYTFFTFPNTLYLLKLSQFLDTSSPASWLPSWAPAGRASRPCSTRSPFATRGGSTSAATARSRWTAAGGSSHAKVWPRSPLMCREMDILV